MKNFYLILSFLLQISVIAYSQKQQTSTWYFGKHAGLKFINGSPVALSDGQINNNEGTSIVSDNFGNLLFYTDGVTVWNKNHNPMPNGTNLFGNTSSTQTCIVRKPGNCLQYYIFYHSGQEDLKLYYAIVDMTLNGGLGDIVPTSKNTLIYYPATEKITTVNHQNGNDVWLLCHAYQSNKFMAYLVTPNGINPPINTNVGPVHNNMIGYMKASHKGNKLAAAVSFSPDIRAELYDFNNNTGVVSNPVLFNNWSGAYGLEFSPNDSLLYVTQYWNTNHLYQINVIDKTVQTIFTANNGNYDLCALQLGEDGKIYMARSNKDYLSVINKPNIIGSGCNFISYGFSLYPGTTAGLGLPTFHQSSLDFHANYFSYTKNSCNLYNFQTYIQGDYNSVLWNFNDPLSGNDNYSNLLNPSHSFSSPGNYNVTLIIHNSCYTDTLKQLINVSAGYGISVDLGNDTLICAGNKITFTPGNNYSSYQWNNGFSSSSITVSQSGTYSVTVTDKNGCSGSDSIKLLVSQKIQLYLGNDTSICQGGKINLSAGSTYTSYLWNTGATSSKITVTQSGNYSVTVTDKTGCKESDIVKIGIYPSPKVFLGNDTTICQNDILHLTAGSGFQSYLWNDNSKEPNISASKSGLYSVSVTNSFGCVGADSLHLTVANSPIINLGNDFQLCDDESVMLNAGTGFSSYYWQDGSSNQFFIVNDSGKYWVDAFYSFGCKQSDTVNVSLTIDNTDIVAPNVFTPDEDGYNDKFEITHLGLSSFNLKIFNRWGTLLYENKETSESWDGTYKGIQCAEGVYFWVCEFQSNCFHKSGIIQRTGIVHLIK